MASGPWRGPRHSPAGSSAEQPASTGDRDADRAGLPPGLRPQPEPDEICGGRRVPAAGRHGRLERHRIEPMLAADHAALVDFCHVLLNSNEFLYVD